MEITAGQRDKQIDIQQTFKRALIDEEITYEEIRAYLKK
jgi:hypothetical protein